MTRIQASAHLWICLAVVAFLAARLGDAHLHLCFDGQEPPTALHLSDGAVHNDAHHRQDEHSDKDVDVLDALLVKKVDDSFDTDLLLPTLILLLLVSVPRIKQPISAEDFALPAPSFQLRPPLRGPPR